MHSERERAAWPALNQIVCALRFFYGVTLGHATVPERIAYAREPSKLPVVLSADEVVRFLEAIPSLKSRAALTTVYAAGLRVSEVVLLKIAAVQPKNVMFPTDARLFNRAREILVRLAKRYGVDLRQSYARVGKFALIKHQRYAHAKQFKRANRALKKLKTDLGRVIRDIARKIEGDVWLEEMVFGPILSLARRVAGSVGASARTEGLFPARSRGGVHGKGKAHRPYEFGVKVSVAMTLRHAKGGQFVKLSAT